jgi:hypothetical protein
VANGPKHFTIALSITVLDAAVASYYGGVIWRAWSGIIWCRFAILLATALWLTTLINIWAHALSELPSVRGREVDTQTSLLGLHCKLREEGDV